MQFDKIRYDGKHVELEYKEPVAGGGTRDIQVHGEDPTPAFRAALAAFTGYVCWIHSLPADIAERIEIRGVTIKRPDDEPRGIVVTALLKCPRARNSTSTLNTPYLAEPPENFSGARSGFLSVEVVGFVDALETHATAFQDGERGEQTSLPLGESAPASENVDAFNDRAAAAESATTRKPRGKKKGKDFIPGAGDIYNPDATQPLTDAVLQEALRAMGREVPLEEIAKWVSTDRVLAFRWTKGEFEAEPLFVHAAAIPELADEWKGQPPPRVTDEGAHEILDAARG